MSQASESGDTGARPPCVTEQIARAEVLGEVFNIISDRMLHPKEGSYTNYLFTKGLDKILKKIGEEACEVVIASKNGDREEISYEIADLIYHIMVLLAEEVCLSMISIQNWAIESKVWRKTMKLHKIAG